MEREFCRETQKNIERVNDVSKKKLIQLREKINELHFTFSLSRNEIIRQTCFSKGFVMKWTKSSEQDFSEDNRGWPNGKGRKWDDEDRNRIINVYHQLKNDSPEYYYGPTAISIELRKHFPHLNIPPLRTIGQIMKDAGLTYQRKGKSKGASRYLRYPEHTIYTKLGSRVMEVDFITHKYLRRRSQPLHFIGFSAKKGPRFRYYMRVLSCNADAFIDSCKFVFDEFEKPDFIKVDNALAVTGSASGKRNISRSMMYLLSRQVCPIFAVPRKPFSQASIEGCNSVFSRKFWNRKKFSNVDEVDMNLIYFNSSTLKYLMYKRSFVTSSKISFHPKIYFIRQVQENPETGEGYISVLNEQIPMDSTHILFFVFVEWDLVSEKLIVSMEISQERYLVHQIPFLINKNSKKKIEISGLRLLCH